MLQLGLLVFTDRHHLNFGTSSFSVLRPSAVGLQKNEEMVGGCQASSEWLYIIPCCSCLEFTCFSLLTHTHTIHYLVTASPVMLKLSLTHYVHLLTWHKLLRVWQTCLYCCFFSASIRSQIYLLTKQLSWHDVKVKHKLDTNHNYLHLTQMFGCRSFCSKGSLWTFLPAYHKSFAWFPLSIKRFYIAHLWQFYNIVWFWYFVHPLPPWCPSWAELM